MPQMAPMNWISLNIFFSLMFILFNFVNYYLFLTNSKNKKIYKINNKMMSWKW
uniref:ATP synthase complex subunit 8 n=1 Tax=Nebrioporus cooperi TaxID=2201844 RepID=A0A894K5Y6_9DYTI|nr:ATP synthase F0 subunit 8 [Nebrioporus cooperi]